MSSLGKVIDSMQFDFLVGKTVNTSAAPAKTITFQYAGTSQPQDYFSTARTGWTKFDAAEKAAFDAALTHIETFLNVNFVEVHGNNDPDLNVGKVEFTDSFIGYGGYSANSSGDTVTRLDSFVVFKNTLDLQDRTSLILHELGHALGLKHTFSTPKVPEGTDNNKYSVMAYNNNPDTGEDADAMQIYDILALQALWGKAQNNRGNSTYTGKRTDTTDAVWDTGGIDHFDASARLNNVVLDLRDGKFSTFGSYEDVVIAYNTKIENATGGSGSDRLTGNRLDNDLRGGAGNDRLKGGGGDDKLSGGAGRDKLRAGRGDDTISGGDGADKFIFKRASGNDRVADFEDNTDQLIFRRYDVRSLNDALDQAKDVRGDVVFSFHDGSTVTIENISIVELRDDIYIA